MRTNVASVIGLSRDGSLALGPSPGNGRPALRAVPNAPPGDLDGQICGLFAVDIVGFNGWRRDDDIQLYVHKSLYEMLETAFDRSDVPWSCCVHEDRGDGALVLVPPTIPVAGLATVPDRLRALVRRHNHVFSEAANIQLRVAMHVGIVRQDNHGFVGQDVTLLFRLLNARPLRQMLCQSGAEVAFIVSGMAYEQVIRRYPALMDPASFQGLPVRVKETRTRAWACTPGV